MPELVFVSDPIYQDSDGWWFYDESAAYRYGPYPTKEFAEEQLKLYCKQLDHEYEGT